MVVPFLKTHTITFKRRPTTLKTLALNYGS